MSQLVFEVFFSNEFLIFMFVDDHGHKFGFGVLQAIFEDFVLCEVRVLDVLP